MRRTSGCLLLTLTVALSSAAATPPPLPPGTAQFFGSFGFAAVRAEGGGVWIASAGDIVRYTAAGSGTVLTTPGGTPYRLALALDGSIWFSNETGIGRISTTGTLLEHHAITDIRDIAVATDGALWYARSSSIGRISGGAPVEFPSPSDPWSVAPADGGSVWILPSGLGTAPDSVYRMSPAGGITQLSLADDVLYGDLQRLGDGTLYIGTGYKNGLLRLRSGNSSAEVVDGFKDVMFLVDEAHNIWSNYGSVLNFRGANGIRFAVELPYDPRSGQCANIPYYVYRPIAIDSDGGLWLRIFDDAGYLPIVTPCGLPEPPPMPSLIRLDTASLIAANHGIEAPALSSTMLILLAAVVAAIGMLRLRM